jgi:hypothetical protein
MKEGGRKEKKWPGESHLGKTEDGRAIEELSRQYDYSIRNFCWREKGINTSGNEGSRARRWWLPPVILATCEAEIRGIVV